MRSKLSRSSALALASAPASAAPPASTQPERPPKPQRIRKPPPGEIRLIGGLWKRSKLPVPAVPGLRPTPDRLRETLFNWLGQDLSGWRVLDAFAGTGALGLEAASRGAASVVLLDQSPPLVAQIKASATRLGAAGVTVERADALLWMSRCAPATLDLVFLDPPFDTDLAYTAALAAQRLLVPGGWLFVESGRPVGEPPPGMHARRQCRMGAVVAELWQAAV